MSAVRARLAEALQRELDEHDYEDDDEKRGQVAHHFADVLLSLPGIAIVEVAEGMYVSVRWSREGAIARLNAEEAAAAAANAAETAQ